MVEASDPSYRPYWTNYKKLKKLIKAIDAYGVDTKATSPDGNDDFPFLTQANMPSTKATVATEAAPSHSATRSESGESKTVKARLKHNPGEVAFFQLLHSELGKASDFFGKAEKQFVIREEIVRVSMEVFQRPISVIVKDRWSVLSKAVFRLHKDLLLLETFAIMTYFAFSKILKKHDKITGIETKKAFMTNVVNKANFTNYPRIMDMIESCQTLYQDASHRLLKDMYEDERLFLYMVEQIQQQPNVPLRSLLRQSRDSDTNANEAVPRESIGEQDKKQPSRDDSETYTSSSKRVSLHQHGSDEAVHDQADFHHDRNVSDDLTTRPMKKRRVRFRADEEDSSR